MLTTLKEEVCEQNRELPRNGLVVGSGGNVSGRDPDSGLVVIKPSGVKFSALTPDTMVVVDLDGNVIDGKMKPSVDTGVHLYLYRHRADVGGVCHTHSPYASSFAARGERIPAVLTPITHILGRDVPCSRYATPGEVDTGEAILAGADAMRGRRLIVCSPGLNRHDVASYFPPGAASHTTWDDALVELETRHGGDCRACVVECAPMQLLAP